jgi:hypothetical protein
MDPGDVERQLAETAESKKKLKENYSNERMYYLAPLLIELLSTDIHILLAENYWFTKSKDSYIHNLKQRADER